MIELRIETNVTVPGGVDRHGMVRENVVPEMFVLLGTTFADRDMAKGAGFRWDGCERRWWTLDESNARKLAQYAANGLRERWGLDDTTPSVPAAAKPSATPARSGAIIGTPQQETFWREVVMSNGHITLMARAGTGKTFSVVEGARRALAADASLRVGFSAFNAHIAKELKGKVPPACKAFTLHSLGLAAVTRALGRRPSIEDGKVRALLDQMAGPDDRARGKVDRALVKACCALVSLCKSYLYDGAPEQLDELVARHDVDLNPDTAGKGRKVIASLFTAATFKPRVYGLVPQLLEACRRQTGIVDYDDMLWLPAQLGYAVETFDLLFVDECLPHWTPVLLADGTSLTIGEIVEKKLPVSVLAYDTSTGEQRACRVTNWSKTLNRKPLVKIKVKWSRRKGTNRPTNFVVCTTDHKVWADNGWIPAGEVKPGMVMQVETAAEKSQHGKITTSGRSALSEMMRDKNLSGKMVDENTPERNRQGRIPVRCGNGQGLTLPQRVLLEALGEGWESEYGIPTGSADGLYPNCYKVDIASPRMKIAVEVDGESHRAKARRAEDEKKDTFLRSLGWQVIRVPNREAVQKTSDCVARILEADCPIDAVVTEVQPVTIPDYHVYDITVEDCHNFYANGVLVHNCQDMNLCQQRLAFMACPDGRIVIVGDEKQSVYAFRGADTRSMARMTELLDATPRGVQTLPLTFTRRCPKLHVKLAQELVPDIEAMPEAPEGEVDTIAEKEFSQAARPGDMVLCRTNAPLVGAAHKFLRAGKKAVLRGKDLSGQIRDLIEGLGAQTIEELGDLLMRYRVAESERLDNAGKSAQVITAHEDRCDTLDVLMEGCRTLDELDAKISRIFDNKDETGAIILSSVHGAKGLEADTVFLLRPDLMPHPNAKRPEDVAQENNVRYVALTRSKRRLVFVTDKSEGDTTAALPPSPATPSAPVAPATAALLNPFEAQAEAEELEAEEPEDLASLDDTITVTVPISADWRERVQALLDAAEAMVPFDEDDLHDALQAARVATRPRRSVMQQLGLDAPREVRA